MLALRVGLAIGALLLCLPGHLLAKAAGRHPSPWIRRFLALLSDIFGLDVQVVGTPLARDVLFVANHQSWLDIVAIGGATGSAFVSKDDIAGWPLIGWLAREGGVVFVSRTDRAGVIDQARAIGALLGKGRAVSLFAEGTTNDGTELLPFRPALLSAAGHAGPAVRIQPLAIDFGTRSASIAWHGEEDIGANARRVLGAPGRMAVRLLFLEPIDPHVHDRKAVAALAYARIAAALPDRRALPYSAAP